MQSMADLSDAVLMIVPPASAAERKAADVLTEEVEKRTGIRWPRCSRFEPALRACVVIGTESGIRSLREAGQLPDLEPEEMGPEGFGIRVLDRGGALILVIVGKDGRGVLFGVGRFLRNACLKPSSVRIDADFRVCSSPQYPLRGHQLGYRPKTNAYDAWTVEQYDQYIRELALFGANAIEILPPRTDDEATGPLMKTDPLDMMISLSEIIDSYGLQVWIWYPNMADNYRNPLIRERELREREEIFRKLRRIDAVMIPGSDPGGMHPDDLFDWSSDVAKLLRQYHPEGQIWLSPQVMKYDSGPWLQAFYEQIDKEPEWLGGVVYGPHVDECLPDFRDRIPARYPIGRYEDITHNYHCQYPVADWDEAFALTIGREGYNPRPIAEKHIHNRFAACAIGNISYSEGINDDVNKFVWTDQDWDPNISAADTLRDYARMFIGWDYAEGVARGLLALEENWRGPLLVNEQVDITLLQWQQMEQAADDSALNNYRFQMGLIRAYYDAYVRRRLIYETELEARSRDALRGARESGSLAAIAEAERTLLQAETAPVAQDYKRRCERLADDLFRSIGSQLTVGRHHAIAVDRGAFMDTIDMPLNDRSWLLAQLKRIKALPEEEARLSGIKLVLNRQNPGPEGCYCRIGSDFQRHRLRMEANWEEDPGYLRTPRVGQSGYLLQTNRNGTLEPEAVPFACLKHINVMNDVPIRAAFGDLSKEIAYKVRVAYVGDVPGSEMSRDYWVQQTANDRFEVHEPIRVRAGTVTIREDDLPKEATASGEVVLTFQRTEGFKRLNIAEIWLLAAPTDFTHGVRG